MISVVNAASLSPIPRPLSNSSTEPKAPAPQAQVPNAPAEITQTATVLNAGLTMAPEAAPFSALQPIGESDLDQFVAEANAKLKNTAVRFSIDEDTGITLISVVDKETGEILRQIPPEEMLHLSNSLADLRGILVDHKG